MALAANAAGETADTDWGSLVVMSAIDQEAKAGLDGGEPYRPETTPPPSKVLHPSSLASASSGVLRLPMEAPEMDVVRLGAQSRAAVTW